jgi:hypothetical protein
LTGVDRKWLADRQNDANDPQETSVGLDCCCANRSMALFRLSQFRVLIGGIASRH